MNEDMYTAEIPNRMLYDLIMEMKQDMDRRFEEQKTELSEFKKETQRNFARLEAKVSSDFAKVDSRFARLEAKVDADFAKVDSNFARLEAKVDSNIARLEAKIDKNTELVNKLYQRGDKLELSFSRKVLLGNGALAGIVAFFVALFTGRMIIEN